MISCRAYGLPIFPVQCADARERFWLERICSRCSREEIPTPDPEPPYVVSVGSQANTISGVLRTGPTIATAARKPMEILPTAALSRKKGEELELSNKKPKGHELSSQTKPRRPVPPGMTRAVARAKGLI